MLTCPFWLHLSMTKLTCHFVANFQQPHFHELSDAGLLVTDATTATMAAPALSKPQLVLPGLLHCCCTLLILSLLI